MGAQILNVHDLNTNLNYLSLYCIFDVQNLVLCLNRELIKIIDYEFMLKLQCKTTFNSVFVGKKIIKIEQVHFGIMFLKNVVLHDIVKNHFVRILLTRDCISFLSILQIFRFNRLTCFINEKWDWYYRKWGGFSKYLRVYF